MTRKTALCMLAAALGGCASAPPAQQELPPPPDPIIIPETAVSVQAMDLFRNSSWLPLNQRMLLARAGPKDYLVIFNEPCAAFRDRQASVWFQVYNSNTVHANTDSITAGANGMRCRVGDIYVILREDAVALQNLARP
jgi:hypothetical protein